ncbi:MAG: MBOAT family O-acyltransferase [Sumerlaeia bacterium]
MLFNSLTFVVFFAVVLILHNMPFSWKTKKLNLLLASYLFYAAWNPPLIVLLWISTMADWYCGKALARAEGSAKRRLLLAVSLVANLGMLGIFKYGNFLLDNFVFLTGKLGMTYSPPEWSIILPVGISFYTFQTLTYTFDIYRKRLEPVKSFLDYALYVTFFPQLVAGPIVRAAEFLPQCVEPPKITRNQFVWGLYLITLGLFQKVVLADGFLSDPAEAVFSHAGFVVPLDAWAGVMAFSGQIFCDFAGYTTCAIGTALCLGFMLPDNFRFPYAALGFSDFWRRWHITLSTWLRDYVYISFGGNRRGTIRTLINLMVTMFLGGLWHGAAWTFVVWGVLHGLYLVGERLLKAAFGGAAWVKTLGAEIGLVLLTNALVCVAWVFFRATTFEGAGRVLQSMFALMPEAAPVLTTFDLLAALAIYAGILLTHWFLRHSRTENFVSRAPGWAVAIVWAAMLVALILTQGGGDAFIYFQF